MKLQIKIMFLTCWLASNLFAGTTGRIAGRVTDEQGKALAWANLYLEGEELGSSSDAEGRYIIDRVEPGKHKLICQKLGFKSEKVINLIVSIDETTVQNFKLQKAALEMTGISVSEAKNKLVDKLKTSSGLAISEEKFEEIDLLEIEDVVALQAGVFINNGDLHIRGGRMNEVLYVVDGIAVSDIVDSESALAIDVDAIREMKVMTGGFPAEYGNAQSGVINIITKRGLGKYQGKLEFSSDAISDISNRDMVKLMLSGPLIPTAQLRDRLTFFVNGKIDRSDTYLKDNYGVKAWEEIYLYGVPALGNYWRFYDYYQPYAERDEIWGVDIDERNSNKTNFNSKLYYEISPREKITLAWRQDKTLYYPYDHNWRYAMEHYKEIQNDQTQLAATYGKSINAQLHFSAALSYYQKKYREHPRDFEITDILGKDPAAFNLYGENLIGQTPGLIYHGSNGVMYDEEEMWNFSMHNVVYDLNDFFRSPGSYYGTFIENENQVFTMKADLDLQYQNHDFRGGLEVVSHQIKRDKLINP